MDITNTNTTEQKDTIGDNDNTICGDDNAVVVNEVWLPMHMEENDVYGIKTMDKRDHEQQCSICYYDSENDSEYDTDLDKKMDQETLHNTERYAQIYKWNADNTETTCVCPHQHHTVCLYNWFEKCGKILCPICRQGYDSKIVVPPLLKKPPRYVVTYWSNGNKKVCYFEVNGLKHGTYEKFNSEGKLVLKRNYHNDLLNGYEFEYYPYTGKVRRKTKWILGKRNGKHWLRTSRGFWIIKSNYKNDLLHGDYREWFEGTHILKKGCSYNNGELHGVLREWDQEQNLLLYSTYYHGKQWGRHMENYKNGRPYLKCFFNKNGQLHGIRIEFFKNGNIKQIEHYHNGEAIQFKEKYYSNKQIAQYGEYYNKLQDNNWKEYYRNGVVKSECTYEEGSLFGKYSRYTDRNELIESAEYHNNTLDGKHIVMHPNQKPRLVEHFANGLLNGPRIEYDKTGKPYCKAEYKNNQLDGMYYDLATGVKCEYKDNQLDGKWLQMNGGQLVCEAYFEEGLLHGPCKRLTENGDYQTIDYYKGQPLQM